MKSELQTSFKEIYLLSNQRGTTAISKPATKQKIPIIGGLADNSPAGKYSINPFAIGLIASPLSSNANIAFDVIVKVLAAVVKTCHPKRNPANANTVIKTLISYSDINILIQY